MTVGSGSQAAYARYKEVSKQTVTDWKHDGLVVFTEEGLVDFMATDAALISHGIRQPLDGEMPKELASMPVVDGLWSKADAERVKENYAARLKQLEYDREVGKVVLIDDVVIVVAAEYAVVRNRLLGIGAKLAPDLTTMQSAEEIKALIDGEMVEALNQLTVDIDGERDFDVVRQSILHRFGPSADESGEGSH